MSLSTAYPHTLPISNTNERQNLQRLDDSTARAMSMMHDELSPNTRRLSDPVEANECKNAELINLNCAFQNLQAANVELSVQNEELRARVDSIQKASDGLHVQCEENRQREAAVVKELETESKLLVASLHEHIVELEAQRDRLLAKLVEAAEVDDSLSDMGEEGMNHSQAPDPPEKTSQELLVARGALATLQAEKDALMVEMQGLRERVSSVEHPSAPEAEAHATLQMRRQIRELQNTAVKLADGIIHIVKASVEEDVRMG